MSQPKTRLYLSVLLEWAQHRSDRNVHMKINGPIKSDLMQWLVGLINRVYDPGLLDYGVDRQEFEQVCSVKLIYDLHEHPNRFADAQLTDDDLRFFIIRLALNARSDMFRKKTRFYAMPQLNAFIESDIPIYPHKRQWTDRLDDLAHTMFEAYPRLEFELKQLPEILHRYFVSLNEKRKSPMIRSVLAALLLYCRNEVHRIRIHAYWLLAWILFTREHIMKDMRSWLERYFPNRTGNSVYAQVSLLRTKFHNYLEEQKLYERMAWVVQEFATG